MKKKSIIIVFSLIFLLTSCLSNNMPEGLSENEREQYQYLKNNIADIDIDDESFSALKDFNESVKDYNVFLIGEGHAIAKNYDIQFYLLKNFVENHGVTYILLEQGFSDGQILNRYLQSGDTLLLDKIFDELEDTFAYSQEGYNYYTKIYEYNKTLPENKKITFLGVDLQHQPKTGVDYLLSIIPEQNLPQELNTINKLKKIDNEDNLTRGQQLFEIVPAILEEINNNVDIYNQYLKDEAFNFKFACENILQAYDYYSNGSNTDEAKRENYIFNNFILLYDYYGYDNAKCYGSWGDAHAHLEKSNQIGGKSFAAFLNNNHEATNRKVLSILSVYYNSQRASYGNYKPIYISGTYSVIIRVHTDIMLNSLAKSDFALFNLINDNSPFIRRQKDTDKVTYEDGFQYFLLIQNSPATTKLK